MRSLSRLGLALSVVFTCLLFALIAEIYYLLWWKRRIIRREINNVYTNPTRDYLYMFWWKKKQKPSPSSSLSLVNSTNAPQSHQCSDNNSKDYLVKPLEDYDYDYDYEDGVVERGLISGPPRFLFTIKEETKEDLLESSELDGKSSSRDGKRSSLSELLLIKNMETPYLTPLSSPPFLTPPITPMGSCHSSNNSGCNYNPFYEASSDAEFSKIMVKSSPPPKFKFLRDAEEKLKRKTMLIEDEEEPKEKDEGNLVKYQDGSFITVIVANSNKKRENHQPNYDHHYHSPQCLSSSSSSSSSTLPPSFNIDPRVP